MDAWVPDITWSGAGSGTEGDLVIRQGSHVHRQGSSHAWGREWMERGLIIFFGGVDTVDNPLQPAAGADLGCGCRRGQHVDELAWGVDADASSQGLRARAQSVHSVVRRGGPANVDGRWRQGPRDDVDGGTRGEPGSCCGSSRVGLWTVSGVLPGMPGRALPTRLSTACGSVDEGGRGELPEGRSRTGRGATHRWGEACGQRGIAGYPWVSDYP